MLNLIRQFLDYPRFSDNEETRRARLLNLLSTSLFSAFVMTILLILLKEPDKIDLTLRSPFFRYLSLAALAMLFIKFLLQKREILTASFLVLILLWVIIIYQAVNVAGIQDTILFGEIIPIIIAGLLFDLRWLAGMVAFSTLVNFSIAWLESQQFITPHYATPGNTAFFVSIIVAATASIIALMLTDFKNLAETLGKQKDDLKKQHAQIESQNIALQKQVDESTQALREEELLLRQFEAIATISNEIARVQNLENLLPAIAHAISAKMGFYHVGIFLLDERKEFAVLQAASSPGGKKMLARRHKLPITPNSLVGYAIYHQTPRISQETGDDVVHYQNPDLPHTRAEMVLPLTIGANKIIGALDIQSQEANAFSVDDIKTFEILANQIAVAIENASLFERTQAALQEAEKTYRRFIAQGWQELLQEQPIIGYHHNGMTIKPIQKQERPASEPSIIVPIRLRGVVIGQIEIQRGQDKPLSPNEKTLVTAIAQRAALTLENVRLLERSQKQATREELLNKIGTKITHSLDVENILQTTLDELGQMLPDADIAIRIRPPAALSEEGNQQ